VPAVVEFGSTKDDKALLAFYANSGSVGRALFAPPGLPADRIQMLRTAFDQTMKDADFLADIAATKLEFEPMAGADLQALVTSATRTTPAVIERARAARVQ
jgi:tripartite-type tricarboxylate transporter receptor subunit TctC